MTLRLALFLAMVALIGSILGAFAIAVSRTVAAAARTDAEDRLVRSREVVREVWSLASELDGSEARVVSEEPRLRAVVATGEIDHETILGVAREMNRGLHADAFLLVDADGLLLADALHPEDVGFDLAEVPIVAAALADGGASGTLADDAHVYRARAQRIAFGATTAGAVVLGRAIDDAWADRLATETGHDCIVVLGDRIVARSAGATALADVLATTPVPVDGPAFETVVSGGSYLTTATVLEGAAEAEPLRAVLVASLDEALAPSDGLSRWIGVLALLALLLSALAAQVLAMRLAGPLDRAVAFAAQIASGHLDTSTSLGGFREVRTLGAALDRMASDLRESRKTLAARERLERELEVASRLQTALLPTQLRAPGLRIAARMQPATEVGGDYYDVLVRDDATWIAIGDVAGHGMTAGIVMLMVRTAVATLVQSGNARTPASLVSHVNAVVYDGVRTRLGSDEHVTFCALRHEGGGRVTYAGAHEDIFVWRRRTGRCDVVPTRGTWVGIVPSIEKITSDATLELDVGDCMVLVTDGLFEARTADGQQVGVEAIQRVIEAHAAGTELAPETLLGELLGLHGQLGAHADDDVTVVVVERVDG